MHFCDSKNNFFGGIGCLCKCGSPKSLIKPVSMKPMESHNWWDTELHAQQHLRPCPGNFELEFWGQWGFKNISTHPATCNSTCHSISSPTEPQEMHEHPGAQANTPGSACGSCLAGKGCDEIRVTHVTMLPISHTASCKEETAAPPASTKSWLTSHLSLHLTCTSAFCVFIFSMVEPRADLPRCPLICASLSLFQGLSGCVS